MNHFAKRWDYRLRIKHIFTDAADLPAAAETIGMGKRVAEHLKALQQRVPDTDSLSHDLDDCIGQFEDDLNGVENDYEARDRFNQALHSLYDVADAGKRVWIE